MNQINCRRAYCRFSRDDQRARRRLVSDAVEVLERLPIDQPAERVRGLGHARDASRPPDLVEQPAVELRVDAARDPLGGQLRRDAQRDRDDVVLGQRRRGLGEVRRSAAGRSAGRPRARESAASRSRGWMRAADGGIDTSRSSGAAAPAHAASAMRSRRARSAASRAGPGKEPARQRAVVEAGSADEDRQPAARGDVANRGRGLARIPRRRVSSSRIGDVDEVVGDAAAARRAAPCPCRCRSRGRPRSNRS